MRYWLMKNEPETFNIEDLKKVGSEGWDGVRNYQARNFMRDEMKVGDKAFFYYSNAKPSGIAGIMTISQVNLPDPTQFNPENGYYFDPKASVENPRWFMAEVTFEQAFKQVLPLKSIRQLPEMDDCLLTQRGSRLSVMPLEKKHWDAIMALAYKQGLIG